MLPDGPGSGPLTGLESSRHMAAGATTGSELNIKSKFHRVPSQINLSHHWSTAEARRPPDRSANCVCLKSYASGPQLQATRELLRRNGQFSSPAADIRSPLPAAVPRHHQRRKHQGPLKSHPSRPGEEAPLEAMRAAVSNLFDGPANPRDGSAIRMSQLIGSLGKP
jgi:hypothetical protein